jgi:GTP cyclohydrolase III
MSSTVQVSLDATREEQIAEIQAKYPDVPKSQSKAVYYILFARMDEMLGKSDGGD